jgi:L-glutamine-phosphate cytidylyltransferase
MKGVILAAGQGSRLRPLTEDRPKGMVAVAGKPIIQWQVEMLRNQGIQDIAIVKGYAAESVVDLGLRQFVNVEYESTNMVHSLFCADDFLTGDVIVSYADILYSEHVLNVVATSSEPVSVVVDLDWERYFAERFGDAFEDAESLIMDDTGGITSIGKPAPTPEEVQAQYIGLIKLTADGVDFTRSIYADSLASHQPIGWGRRSKQAHMTDLLQEAVLRGYRVTAVPIRGGWVEIDTLDDYEIANRAVPALLGVTEPRS